jgi:Ca2+-binding EF-hand superfamily protein
MVTSSVPPTDNKKGITSPKGADKKPKITGPTAATFVDESPDAQQSEPMVQSLRIFNIFDINKSGKIDLNEVKVICKSLNLHPTVVSAFQ